MSFTFSHLPFTFLKIQNFKFFQFLYFSFQINFSFYLYIFRGLQITLTQQLLVFFTTLKYYYVNVGGCLCYTSVLINRATISQNFFLIRPKNQTPADILNQIKNGNLSPQKQTFYQTV